MKKKESKPDLSCVFCEDTVQRQDLIQHIASTHLEKVSLRKLLISHYVLGRIAFV